MHHFSLENVIILFSYFKKFKHFGNWKWSNNKSIQCLLQALYQTSPTILLFQISRKWSALNLISLEASSFLFPKAPNHEIPKIQNLEFY